MENLNEDVKVYPTVADADGWFFESEGQEVLGIETRNEDDDVFKKVQLSKGRVAILRELTGKETATASKMAGKNPDNMLNAYIAIGTTIFDKDGNAVKFVMEDIAGWKAKDSNRLQVACQQLNF